MFGLTECRRKSSISGESFLHSDKFDLQFPPVAQSSRRVCERLALALGTAWIARSSKRENPRLLRDILLQLAQASSQYGEPPDCLKSCATPPVSCPMLLHLLGFMKLPQRDLSLACPFLDPAFQFIVSSLQGIACIAQRPHRLQRAP